MSASSKLPGLDRRVLVLFVLVILKQLFVPSWEEGIIAILQLPAEFLNDLLRRGRQTVLKRVI